MLCHAQAKKLVRHTTYDLDQIIFGENIKSNTKVI